MPGDQFNPKQAIDLRGAVCRWCGQSHPGEACPLVEEIEYDTAGNVIRVVFRQRPQSPRTPTTFED